jgi:glutamine synthetase
MTKNVYQLIAAVSADIARQGISKDRNNAAQGYKFRGIDDVYNALSPIMSAHGLVILPRIVKREVSERVNSKGSVLFYVTVEAEFDFVSSQDGSKHTVKTYGEAMDSGDKATNKAMSAAYKYAAFQTFCIPTEGDNDADAQTHVVAVHFDAVEAINQIAACKTLDALQTAWKKYGAQAVAAQDKGGHAALKDAVKTRKAELEPVIAEGGAA